MLHRLAMHSRCDGRHDLVRQDNNSGITSDRHAAAAHNAGCSRQLHNVLLDG